MSDDVCDPNVYKYGYLVGIYEMSREEADEFCKEQTKLSDHTHDWSRTAGRVVVKALDPEKMKRILVKEAAPELFAACAEFVRKVECGEARSTRSYKQMKAAIAKAEGKEIE